MNTTVLCIIDGLGCSENVRGNAVLAANMQNLNRAVSQNPSTFLKASGPEVGLTDTKDAGNSEIGHNAIGSGQYIKQGLALLNEAFLAGTVFENDTWKALVANALKEGRKLNVIILLSDGRLHSDIAHLFKLIERCAEEKICVSIHALLDGRDVATQSAETYINQTRQKIKECGVDACIATVAGRGILFMDRYKSDTSMLPSAVEVCVRGNASYTDDIGASFKLEYKKRPDMTDETMPAFVLKPDRLIKNGDSVLLLNYRGDRALETCEMFDKGAYITAEQFALIDKCVFAGIMQYDADLGIPNKFLCPPPKITGCLSEHLCKYGVKQFSVTETVKFGHLTYFFNGNRAVPFDKSLETWKEIPSRTQDLTEEPEMCAKEITDAAIAAIESDEYDFIKMNYPNPDMVGHTANFAATVKACKIVDECVGRLADCCKRLRVNLMITADHGNAEEMLDKDGKPKSSHTNNLVPLVVIAPGFKIPAALSKDSGLTNLAATVCKLLGVPSGAKFNPPIF